MTAEISSNEGTVPPAEAYKGRLELTRRALTDPGFSRTIEGLDGSPVVVVRTDSPLIEQFDLYGRDGFGFDFVTVEPPVAEPSSIVQG
ncbi:hypothetical protein HY024_00060 [Candidatus Curtissbacteria bacterium]|nr:hypothetical protein [Candidatus Curtissbacteria bacterium]